MDAYVPHVVCLPRHMTRVYCCRSPLWPDLMVHCVQIQAKVAKEGWKVADGVVSFNRSQEQKAAPQAAVTEFRFEQLAPILAIGA